MIHRSSAIKKIRIQFEDPPYKYICGVCGQKQKTAVGAYGHIEAKHEKEIKEYQEILDYKGPTL
jgi:hypothetical protein